MNAFDSPDNYVMAKHPDTDADVLILKPAHEVYQNDVRDLLRALGLPDHARTLSPHEIVWKEILPAIRELRNTHVTQASELQQLTHEEV